MAFTAFDPYLTDVIQYEVDGNTNYTRERVTLNYVAAGSRKIGEVLGQITTGAVSGTAGGSNTGNGTIGSLTAGANAQVGDYTAICIATATNSGTFAIYDPLGNRLADATVAAAYTGQVNFTIADGSTDYALNDSFTITVAAGNDKYRQVNLSGTDGTQVAAGVLVENVTVAAGTDLLAVILRRGPAILASTGVGYPSGASAGDISTINGQLEDRKILVRTAG